MEALKTLLGGVEEQLIEQQREIDLRKKELEQDYAKKTADIIDLAKEQVLEHQAVLTQLYVEKKQFLETIQASQKASDDVASLQKKKHIKLNVGGHNFHTSVETLTRYPESMLAAMFRGKFSESTDDEIFIDRDGEAFRYILAFLRNGTYIAPRDPAVQRLVRAEIQYFQLTELYKSVKCDYGVYSMFPYENYYSPEFNDIRKEENRIRKIFVADRENPILVDDENNLINIFDNIQDFIVQEYCYTDNEIFKSKKSISPGNLSITNLSGFKANFKDYTNSIFSGFDWKNVCVMGGAALRCLSPEFDAENGTDIDLGIYGLNQEDAIEKVYKIYKHFKHTVDDDNVFWIRTENALTFTFKFPRKHVQIVLRLYISILEIFTTFDLDASCVAYDGKNVLCNQRFKYAMQYQTNTVDPTRQSGTYEMRLYKYTKLGFSVTVPGYNRENVNPDLNLQSFWKNNGMKRLIIMRYYEQLTGDGMNATKCECEYVTDNPHKLWKRDIYHRICSFHKKLFRKKTDDYYKLHEFMYNYGHKSLIYTKNIDTLQEYQLEHPEQWSDYTSTFIPYGEDWDPRPMGHLFNRRRIGLVYKNKDIPYHFKSVTIYLDHHIIMNFHHLDYTPVLDEEYPFNSNNPHLTIPMKMQFEEPSPGRNMRGSFQPTRFDWYGDCLLSIKK